MSWVYYVVVALILISIIAGQSSAPSGGVGASGQPNCGPCEEDFAWYRSLKPTKKVAYAAWYAARWAACKANGC